jgi:ribonuclease P protein component
MRLPRSKHSMNQRADFARVRKDGTAKPGKFLILSTLADSALCGLKVGFITTKRCGKAHDRNKLRRRLRMLVQANAPHFADPCRYLVTIARPGSATATFAELEADWLRQARRLALFPTDTTSST